MRSKWWPIVFLWVLLQLPKDWQFYCLFWMLIMDQPEEVWHKLDKPMDWIMGKFVKNWNKA